MNENQIFELTKEVAIANSKEVYSDVRPVIQETTGVVSTVVGWFNNVVLYPVKKANMTYRYKLELFEDDLRNEVKKIDTEKQIEPPILIAGPILEALKYTYDEKELREMYVKYLASAMNIDTINYAHISYVEIIKQLSPDEARIIKFLPRIGRSVPIIDIGKEEEGKDGTFNHYNNFSSLGYNAKCELPQNTPIYINNLCRLGIVEIPPNNRLVEEKYYEELMRLEEFKQIINDLPKYFIKRKMLGLTDYGDKFRKTCIGD